MAGAERTGQDGNIGDPDQPYSGPGAAYIFRVEDGVWIEKQKFIAPDTQNSDGFGWSLSIGRDAFIVGNHFEDGGDGNPNPNCGAIYIYPL